MFVLKWFASSHQKDSPPSDTVTIMDMPDLVMRKILKDVDLISILKLRKVCHAFRNYIDDVNPKTDTKMRAICVTLFNNAIRLNLVGETPVDYVDHGEDYCTVEWKKYTKNSEKITKKCKYHQKFLDVFFNDFSTILPISKPCLHSLDILIHRRHYVRSTKQPFWLLGCCRSRSKKLNYARDPDQTMLQLFENYQKIVDFFNTFPMTIKRLEITALGNSQILQILSKIKTEELWIHKTFGGAENLDFKEIVKLENWKSIKNLNVRGITVAHSVTLFIDKPTLYIPIDDIFPEEVRLIVETFRNNPSMRRWSLDSIEYLQGSDLLVRELGRPSRKGEWYFTVPKSEKLLSVRFWWYGELIFSYLDRDLIPVDAEIY